MLKNYVQTGTVTKGEKGAVSAPQVRFINPPPSYAAMFTDLYGLLQTGE